MDHVEQDGNSSIMRGIIQEDGSVYQKTFSDIDVPDCKDRGSAHSLPLQHGPTEYNTVSPLPTGTKRRREPDTLAPHTTYPDSQSSNEQLQSPCTYAESDQSFRSTLSTAHHNFISHWAETKTWPKSFYKGGVMGRMLAVQASLFKLKKRLAGISTVNSESSTLSDECAREINNVAYRNEHYLVKLAAKDGHMEEHALGITAESEALCAQLLSSTHPTPKHTLFDDNVFSGTMANLENQNEARLTRDLLVLLCPSPEALTVSGDVSLNVLIEYVNKKWKNCINATSPSPQPDFSVGFRRKIFTQRQLDKLEPMIGDLSTYLSPIRATGGMYLPFLTVETKGAAADIGIANRQNMHSHTVAVLGLVDIYRLAKREIELHRTVVTFSVAHDSNQVQICGYYPIIDGCMTSVYCHKIENISLTSHKGRDKWTTYKFVRAVYDHALTMRDSICEIVDQAPDDIIPIIESIESEIAGEASATRPQQMTPEPSGSDSTARSKRPRMEGAVVIPSRLRD